MLFEQNRLRDLVDTGYMRAREKELPGVVLQQRPSNVPPFPLTLCLRIRKEAKTPISHMMVLGKL
jgi:hypothetical protein